MRRHLPLIVTLLLLAVSAAADPARVQGVSGGALWDGGTLPHRHQMVYEWVFSRGPAKVVAIGSRNVDLVIFNSRGKVVAQDLAYDTCPVAKWTVKKAERFTVVVVNESGADATFTVMSN